MATWEQLKNFVKSNYKMQREESDSFNMVFDLGDNRSQLVNVTKAQTKNGDVWVQIYSPVGTIRQDKLNNALEDIEGAICGGLVKMGDKHLVRHCMLIEDMSAEEFNVPLLLITAIADSLEEKYVGGDQN
jgi:hypothetical protein